jgi:cytochrome P450
MSFIDEIRERIHDEQDVVAEKIASLTGQIAGEAAGPAFALMRRFNPIVQNDELTIVALNEDVKEVLGDPGRFTIALYAPKMEAVTGPFILGIDDTPLYQHDHAAMDRAVRGEDLPKLGDDTYAAAREAVSGAGGEIEVISELIDPVITAMIGSYFGTPGPDPQTLAHWARHIFWELFINVGNLADTRERALADAAQWRPHLDAQIAERKAQIEAGDDVPDDVLTRLLRYQSEGEPNFHDIAIRHNILGNITGWIPTISNALPRALDVLFDREDELEGAQEAARSGDRELVARYMFEASRFNPQNFGLLRVVAQDTTIAAGTERETAVKAGTTVIAATLSAMHDERAIEEPDEFRTDRPWSDYMLFGHGMHTCYGQQIVRAQLPALATALLEGPRIKRARGGDGRLDFEGPYPSSLTVRFDD